MQKILICTYNKNKYPEFQRFFKEHGYDTTAAFELGLGDVVEGDTSFHDNARLKAVHGYQQTKLASLGDDSGLEVPDLNFFPGVITARFAKEIGGYPQAIEHFYASLKTDQPIAAQYKAVLCLALSDEIILETEAIVKGHLIRHPRGERVFGFDQWFVPEGYTETFSQMSLAEKEALSHRGKALVNMAELMGRV